MKDYKDFIERAKRRGKPAVVAVAEAADEHALQAVTKAAEEGIVVPRLIGDPGKIETLLKELGLNPPGCEIVPAHSIAESLDTAVGLIHDGAADVLMKGKLESSDYLRPIVKKENGLLTGSRLSVAGFFQIPAYHKLLAVSDMGLNTYPDLEGKKAIIENAVRLLTSMGVDNPKVAVLAAVEKINPKMPESVDADALKQMNLRGELNGCVVEGPISLDLAVSAESAKIKGYESPVAGDADLLIVPDIAAGNILVKCLTELAGAKTAGAVLGAAIPVIMYSRSSSAEEKFYSLALAACAAAGEV